jgi:hypothetical protein
MKIVFKFFISCFIALFLVACGDNIQNVEKENALRDEVFAIHDGVMPRMTEIVTLKGKLDSLSASGNNVEELKRYQTFLENAEDGMMEWMTHFQEPEKLRETKKHEEIMTYLESEKQRITKVRDDMNNSIQAAENALKTK